MTRELAALLLYGALAVGVLVPSLYLAALTSLSRRKGVGPPPGGETRGPVVVLIAAHDEEIALPGTLAALRASGDGGDVIVHVVADNCRDRTAEVARSMGACVHERADLARPGKAAALNFLVAAVLAEDGESEIFAVIDADAQPQAGFIQALSARMRDAEVAQACNLVERDGGRPLLLLRAVAFHLMCELRPLAFEALGISAGLHGNGMCFRRWVLERYAWNEQSIAEDAEMHLRLVNDGVRVRFVLDAVLRSSMPRQFRGASGQALRWERGKFDLIGPALRLVSSGLVTRRIACLVVGFDMLVPPLSLLVAATVAASLLGLMDAVVAVIGLIAVLACAVHIGRGVAMAGIGARGVFKIAMWTPTYIGWKVAIVAQAAAGAGRGRWAQARGART